MGIQAVKGVEIGDGFALAGAARVRGPRRDLPGPRAAADEPRRRHRGAASRTARPLVVRAAMKPLPTLMRPLRSVDLATGEPAEALVERSDVAAVEALAVVAEAVVAWELARAAREKFGGDSIGDMLAAAPRLPRAHPVATALDRHVALVGFMGAGKTTLGSQVAHAARPRVRRPRRARSSGARAHRRAVRRYGEAAFRELEEATVGAVLGRRAPPCSRSAAAPSRSLPSATRSRRGTVPSWSRSTSTTRGSAPRGAGGRSRGRGRVPAALRGARADLRGAWPMRVARDVDDVVLAAGGVPVETGALQRLGELVPGDGPVALVSDRHVAGIYGADAQLALGGRLASVHELPHGEDAKTHARRGPALGRARARPRRDGRGARRRLRHRRWRASSPRRTSAACRGCRCRRRWSARWTRRSAARPALDLAGGQEPRRRVPLAGADGDRPGAARHAARGGAPRGPRRGRQDGAARGRAALGASRRELVRRCAAYKTAVCLRDPTRAASARSSISATRSRTRSRRRRPPAAPRRGGRARAARRAPPLRALGTERRSTESCSPAARRASTASAPGRRCGATRRRSAAASGSCCSTRPAGRVAGARCRKRRSRRARRLDRG